MREEQSPSDNNLYLLRDREAFAKHAGQLTEDAARELAILSERLDADIYGEADFVERVSRLARKDRNSRIRILLKDARSLVEFGHPLLKLARRLSSKVEIRKLVIEPENDSHAFLIADRDKLLYKHDDREYDGFANYRASPEAGRLLEQFDYLWESHSELSAELRSLTI